MILAKFGETQQNFNFNSISFGWNWINVAKILKNFKKLNLVIYFC
jgi:hypothetical protein